MASDLLAEAEDLKERQAYSAPHDKDSLRPQLKR
jgi:hypothetical protein